MGGIRITPVVLNIIIINVLFFFGSNLLMGDGREILGMFYPESEGFKPYQIITHMFMHADISHLFFNMLSLFFFGPRLEALWGSQRFLFYYLFTGFGAVILHTIVLYIEIHQLGTASVNSMVWGASGAVFGVLLAFGMNYPNEKIMLLIPPIPMKSKYLIGFMMVAELYAGVASYGSQIAHFAHIGGALFGFILIMYWRKFGSRL